MKDFPSLHGQAATIFAECLSGPAADLHASLPLEIRTDMDMVRRKFTAFFGNEDRDVLRRQLRSMTQSVDQSYSEFARKISILAHRAYSNYAEAQELSVDAFIRGCHNKTLAFFLTANKS